VSISLIVIWFFIFSFAGWVWETLFDTIKHGKWDNRGFLFGPVCPIYGVSAMIGVLLYWLALKAGYQPHPVVIFAVSFVGSAIIEYVTSWGLEKLFHARWWDYSRMPLNINGRICVPASALFGFAGLAIAYWVYPAVMDSAHLLPAWAEQLIAMVLIALVSADTTLTVTELTQFGKVALSVQKSVNDHMEEFVKSVAEKGDEARERIAEEREKFAAATARSKVGEIGALPVHAARRVRSYTANLAQSPALTVSKQALTDLTSRASKRRQDSKKAA
jgi:uncharacterized membrane protein